MTNRATMAIPYNNQIRKLAKSMSDAMSPAMMNINVSKPCVHKILCQYTFLWIQISAYPLLITFYIIIYSYK